MARIAGVNVPTQKKAVIGLTYIYGIGLHRANQIMVDLNIDMKKRVNELSDQEILKIREIEAKFSVSKRFC